ncbi:MAG: HTTM domain-containing protein, partial [Bacteroidota bacterium]|nr:HTTM domain-containing protein [Bacteroidota bacterium]
MNYLFFDKRALALMRMCIAIVVMLDLGIRVSDLEAFYSNTGVLPLPALFENAWNPFYVSVHTISGLWQVQLLLFMLAFIFAIFLFVGYRTKLFTFLTWFMLLSLHNRNILILQGGDDLLRMVLFWSMFIPWGEYYSCDSLLNKEKKENPKMLTVACIAYLLQVCYIYTGSALLKGADWNQDYTALYYAFSLDQIAFPVTKYIYYLPDFLKKLTCVAYYFELLVPLLFFVPVKHAGFRTAAVFAIIGFHLVNSMTLFIGLFPLIGITTAIGIFPSSFMDWFERRMGILKNKIAVSFSGIVVLLNYILKWKAPSQIAFPIMNKIKTAALIFLIFFVFDWNFSNLSFVNSKLSDRLRFIGYGLR